jgi:hypothetical protein
MATVLTIPLNDYTGTLAIPQFNIADGAIGYTIYLARCTTATPTLWPNVSTTIEVSIEISFDGGTVWGGGGSFTESGGIRSFKGSELANSAGFFGIQAGTNRKGRGAVVITNGPMRTSGRVDVS